MRQVGDMLVWLAVILVVAAVVYYTPRVASYVTARDSRQEQARLALRAASHHDTRPCRRESLSVAGSTGSLVSDAGSIDGNPADWSQPGSVPSFTSDFADRDDHSRPTCEFRCPSWFEGKAPETASHSFGFAGRSVFASARRAIKLTKPAGGSHVLPP